MSDDAPICGYCDKPFLDVAQLSTHEAACPQNPDAQDMTINPDGPDPDKTGRC